MIFPAIHVANFTGLLAAQAVAAEIKPFAPAGFDSGFETWFEGSGVFLCPDGDTWTQVWNRHIKNESIGRVGVGNLNPAPSVDFKKNVVVALFAGPTRGIVGYRMINGFLLGKEAVLRVAEVPTNSPAASIALPTPWAFLVVPRSKATVSIQMPRGTGWITIGKVQPSL